MFAIRKWLFIIFTTCCGRARLAYHIKQMSTKPAQTPVQESQLNERLVSQFNTLSPFDNDTYAEKTCLGQSCICGALVQHNRCLLYVKSHAARYHRVFTVLQAFRLQWLSNRVSSLLHHEPHWRTAVHFLFNNPIVYTAIFTCKHAYHMRCFNLTNNFERSNKARIACICYLKRR